jgi:hypothetical protein
MSGKRYEMRPPEPSGGVPYKAPFRGPEQSLRSPAKETAKMPQATVVETHRCRIYRTGVFADESTYVEVWDTLERPYSPDDLPEGELVDWREDISFDVVRQQIDLLEDQQQMDAVGDWASRGSI